MKKIKVHESHYIKSPPLHLSFLSEKLIKQHIIREELSQHVKSDLAFPDQNLKFARQISED